jgi:hypothetical protein
VRSVLIASSNWVRKSATEVIADVVARQASFAPAITATNCGFRVTACAICPATSAISAPVRA